MTLVENNVTYEVRYVHIYVYVYIQSLRSTSPTYHQQITDFTESLFRWQTMELFQQRSKKNKKLCNDHLVLDRVAQFIQTTGSTNLGAILTNVANISTLKQSQAHLDLFNLGLSFCPSPWRINPLNVCFDYEDFCRRLRWHEYFSTENTGSCSTTDNNKTKEWTPPDEWNQFIVTFVNLARTYYDNVVSSISHDAKSILPTN